MLIRYVERPDIDTIISLSRRRGFVFQSTEIYGGISSTYDFGPLGVELKRNVREEWWRSIVYEREDVVGLDSAIIMHPKVWEVSGHLENFTDPLVECKECHRRFREDQISTKSCPDCGSPLSDPRQFNTMFKSYMGPVEDSANEIYLRPETAQGIFVNFANVLNVSRKKIPFGIAQIGKSFRNEITPGNFIFRTREFEQMELEFFVSPADDKQWFEYWINKRFDWYVDHGIRKENLRLRKHASDELAHYSKEASDIEYHFPWGWGELEGIANRTDYDLKAHSEHTGQDLTYFDEQTKQRYYPYVIEPSGGVDRAALAFWLDSYDEEPAESTNNEGASKKNNPARTILRLHPSIAPVKVAVLPLSRNETLAPLAKKVYSNILRYFPTQYDDSQSIGKRYRRQDEIGTPYCVTIDFESLEDSQVTLRERDSMDQIRLPISDLMSQLKDDLDTSN